MKAKAFLTLLTVSFVVMVILSGSQNIIANNIQVSNVSISGTTYIVFDLSWDNSWNDATNYDAAWVFVKYRYANDDWYHVTLNTTGHSIPAGATTAMPSDGKGIFLYRTTIGVGNNDFQSIQLSWNTTADGISSTENLQVKVITIEMVYVPQGSYYLGDDGSAGRFKQSSIDDPAHISTSQVVVKCENTNFDDAQLEGDGILVDGDNGIDTSGTTTINNPDFPTGYKAFYCMKYEISQGQYADFLNTLHASQASSRYYATTSSRYTISGTWPNHTASAPDRACNYLSWMDGCAYADWAGLRPITELEFEKACRGTTSFFTNEYAWGNTSLHSSAYTLSGNGTENELITNPATTTGNASYEFTDDTINGPLRCGIFAASAVNKTRQETGGSYYGIMEMSGNLSERCVTLGHQTGRNYTAIHGDGVLSGDGFANQSLWPGSSYGIVQGSTGAGFRGGGWGFCWFPNYYLRVSNRANAANVSTDRNEDYGFRIVRSAP